MTPQQLGKADAIAGHTANPFGLGTKAQIEWVKGYDSVKDPKYPRFGQGRKKK